MRTLIYGHVTQDDLDEAELIYGITPTGYIANDWSTHPTSKLETDVLVQCPMVPGETGLLQLHRRLVLRAEAAILVNPPEHLRKCATEYEIPVMEVWRK